RGAAETLSLHSISDASARPNRIGTNLRRPYSWVMRRTEPWQRRPVADRGAGRRDAEEEITLAAGAPLDPYEILSALLDADRIGARGAFSSYLFSGWSAKVRRRRWRNRSSE